MSYGSKRQAWAKINDIIKQDGVKEEINDIADEIEQKLKADTSQRYFDFSSDCTLLMNRMAQLLLSRIFTTLDTSETDMRIQNFACATLTNRVNFEKLVLNYAADKAADPNLEFTAYYLGYYGKHRNSEMNDGNENPIIKYRKGETPALKRYISEKSILLFQKYDLKQLSTAELDILLKDIRQTIPYMKEYTRYELVTFIHGREVSSSPVYNEDGEEMPMEEPADVNNDPTRNDITGLVQIFMQLVNEPKIRFTAEELQRAFVSSICDYEGDYAVVIRQAVWITEQQRENMIQFIDQYCMENGKMPAVRVLAEYLGIYSSDSAFSKAKNKLRKLLAEHPDVAYG